MKTNIFKHIVPIFAAGLLVAGCTQDFEDTNTNPNKITVASGKLSASALFEPVLYGGTNLITYYNYFWCNELIQHTAATGWTTSNTHRYNIGDSNWASIWKGIARYASDVHEMYRLAELKNDKAMMAVAKTLYVFYMQNLTDTFGDIPCSEAFQSDQGNMKPVFDSQEEVYQQLCAELDSANDIYASKPYVSDKYPSLDAMYSFNMEKWRKFNNALYLRVLGRLTNRLGTVVDVRNNITVTQKMQQIVSDPDKYPIFESNADNATVHYSAVSPYYSEFQPTEFTDDDFQQHRLTEQMIKMMTLKDGTADTVVDPRLKIFGVYRKGYTYWKGTVAGGLLENQNEEDRGASPLNTQTLRRDNADEFLMGYDEQQFILAEAALQGIISGGEAEARNRYEQAVTSSIKKWAAYGESSVLGADTIKYYVPQDMINHFLNSPLASWEQSSDHLALILNQKYIATFWVGFESWCDYRRTGYPKLVIGAGTDPNDHVLPTRMAYSNVTVATNSEHVQQALQRMGGVNDMKLPVWWSRQAVGK